MRIRLRVGLAVALVPFLMLLGCPIDGGGGDELPDGFTETPPDEEPGDEGPATDPYIEYTFVARSPDMAGTLNWHVLPDTGALLPERYTVGVTKKSGYAFAEYGVVVGASDGGSFLFFAIDLQGQYRIAQKAPGEDAVDVVSWTQSASLLAGYGSTNELEVRFGEGGGVSFHINGTETHVITDGALAGGGRGIVAYVGTEENEAFHTTGVEVVYRIRSLQ